MFQLWSVVFLIPLKEKGHAVPHWKALGCGKYEPRGLSYGSTLNICQGVLKSANLLHKRGFISFPMASTVDKTNIIFTYCPIFIFLLLFSFNSTQELVGDHDFHSFSYEDCSLLHHFFSLVRIKDESMVMLCTTKNSSQVFQNYSRQLWWE